MLSEGRERYGSLTDSTQLRFLRLPQTQTLFPGEGVLLVNEEHCIGASWWDPKFHTAFCPSS